MMIKRLVIIGICLGGILLITPVVKAGSLDFPRSFDFTLTGGGIEFTSAVENFRQEACVSGVTNGPMMAQVVDIGVTLQTTEPIRFFSVGRGLAEAAFNGFGEERHEMVHQFKAYDSAGNLYYQGSQFQSANSKVDLGVKVKADH